MLMGYVRYQHDKEAEIVEGELDSRCHCEAIDPPLLASTLRNAIHLLIWRVNTSAGGWAVVLDHNGKIVHQHSGPAGLPEYAAQYRPARFDNIDLVAMGRVG